MTVVKEEVARLLTVLCAEEDLYLRMRALLQREEAELVELDPAVIEQTVEEKRGLAEEGRLLEETRTILVRELTVALGRGDEPHKVSELIESLGEEGDDLALVHGRLRALMTSTRALVDLNQGFANRSLTRVQDTLRLLGRSVPETTGYGPGAKAAFGAGRGRLVRQSI